MLTRTNDRLTVNELLIKITTYKSTYLIRIIRIYNQRV